MTPEGAELGRSIQGFDVQRRNKTFFKETHSTNSAKEKQAGICLHAIGVAKLETQQFRAEKLQADSVRRLWQLRRTFFLFQLFFFSVTS
jgi:hypothetical protein